MDPIIEALQRCREAEKSQAVFYRRLAALAESAGDEPLSQRLHDLHADEQHHLSRLTARLLELGARVADLSHVAAPDAGLDDWEPVARGRERAEAERYQAAALLPLDEPTSALIEQILETERHHARELGGKWMPA
jgi:rubrerythrin